MSKQRRLDGDRGRSDLDALVSLSLERSLVASDYAFLKAHKESDEDDLYRALNGLEQTIKELGADDSLRTLCDEGCNRYDLLWLLHWFSRKAIFNLIEGWLDKPGVGTTKKLLGLTTTQLRSFIHQLDQLADKIQRINLNFEFGVLLQQSESLGPLWKLDHMIRVYAVSLNYASRYFASGSHIYHNVAKARLTTYVRARTGTWHDKDIATLISSAAGDENCSYDEAAHRSWRNAHYARLRDVDPELPLYGPFTVLDRRNPSVPLSVRERVSRNS